MQFEKSGLSKTMGLPAAVFTILFLAEVSLGAVDEYMSCDRFFESKRTARFLEEIPCDMTKMGYCAEKGAAYPEKQIWNFKEDNRALMKRLYGEMDPTLLYREMRSVNLPSASNIPSIDVFSTLEYNIRVGSGLATVASAREPVLSTTDPDHTMSKTKKTKVKNKKVVLKRRRKPQQPGKNRHNPEKVTTTPAASELPVQSRTNEPQFMPESRLKVKISAIEAEPFQGAANPDLVRQNEAGQVLPSLEDAPEAPSLSDILADVDLDSLEQIVGELLPENIQAGASVSSSQGTLQVLEPGSQVLSQPLAPTQSDSTPIPPSLEESRPVEAILEPIIHTPGFSEGTAANSDDLAEYEEIEEELEENDDEDLWESPESLEPEPVEEGPEPDYSGKAVNACPVKEEVFAPYWANNTRNQVLALLNLYPFEQYIHMETCKFEEEQMLCRKGCRCEQQYRLHRLLAFDPNNECRGIFSDWFRFPSYCICKCYNFPDNFMEKPAAGTSRSKRGQTQNRQASNSKFSPQEQEAQNRGHREFSMEDDKTHYVLPELMKQDIASNTVDSQHMANEDHFFYSNLAKSEPDDTEAPR